MKIFKYKIVIILIALVSILFFTNDFGIIDIERTAIITAIGIDKEDGKFLVTAQIAVPQPNSNAAANKKAIVTGIGKTVGYAIREIGHVSGWYPKLAFCNLIVLGQSMFEDDVIEAVGYLERTLKIQDSALIAGAEGMAKDVFSTDTPLDNISSFAIQKILVKRPNKVTDVMTTNVKTFTLGYFSDGETSMMPLIKIISADNPSKEEIEDIGAESSSNSSSENETKNSEDVKSDSEKQESKNSKEKQEVPLNSSGEEKDSGQENGASAKNGESGSEEENKSEKGLKVFDTSNTLIFKKGRLVGALNSEQTLVYNLLTREANDTYYQVQDVVYRGEKENSLLNVLSSKKSVKLTFKGNMPKLKISAKFNCTLEDQTVTKTDREVSQFAELPKVILSKANEDFEKYCLEVIEIMRQTDCDLFNLYKQMYRYNHKYYSGFKSELLKIVEVDVSAKFISSK